MDKQLKSTICATLNCNIQTVWKVVTSLNDYSWRSDIVSISFSDKRHFTERSSDDIVTHFIVTVFEPYYKIRSMTTQSHSPKSSEFFGVKPPKSCKNLIKIACARPAAASLFGALPPSRGKNWSKGARRPSVSEHTHPLL